MAEHNVHLSKLGFNIQSAQPSTLVQHNHYQDFHLILGTYNNKPMVARVVNTERSTLNYRKRFLTLDKSAVNTLHHPYLCTTYLLSDLTKCLVLITEFASNGSMLDLLLRIRPRPIDEQSAHRYYCQFGSALKYMHSNGFAHRNLKCEKILLFSNESSDDGITNSTQIYCKLSDYGFTRSAFPTNHREPLLPGEKTFCASAAYVAPEVLIQTMGGIKQRPFNLFLTDVWSAGIVLYTMVHGGQLPFQDWNLRNLIISQQTQKYNLGGNGDEHNVNLSPNYLSDNLKQFIKLHLNPDPTTRPDMDNIFKHHWLEKVTFN